MKNAIIAILMLTTLVAGYSAATTLRLPIPGEMGKRATIKIGDLTLPINATGAVTSSRRVEVKSEASGEVIEIAKLPGELVQAGDLIIRLNRDEEVRNVKRAQLGVTVTRAGLEDAKNRLTQARGPDVARAVASVGQIEATLRFAKLRATRATEKPDLYHDEEHMQRASNYETQLAQLAGARASLEIARLAIPRAEQAVIRAEADYETAQSNLADARRQLSKTDIISPIDGIVAVINTQIGEVIQGGKATFTGGTILAVVLDTEKLVLRAEVDEADIGSVLAISPEWAKPGHASSLRMPSDLSVAAESMEYLPKIRVEAFREEHFEGIIERIYPEPTRGSGVVTYLTDVVIFSKNRHRLLPGMRGEVEFTSKHVAGVLVCPNEAIHEGPDGGLGVYVPKRGVSPSEKETEFVPCVFGLNDGSASEVESGLEEGAIVYTKLPIKRDRNKNRKSK